MAIYHLSVQVISRGKGRSSVAASAYRAATLHRCRSTGQTFDYSRKLGVVAKGIAAPAEAPAWVQDRAELWNRVEQKESRKDAQLAREMNLALPVELDLDAQREMLEAYLREHFVQHGVVADWAIHHDNKANPHAHVMLTMRKVVDESFGPKERGWNDRGLILAWRDGWEQACNRSLALAGHEVRVDARSFAAQGLRLIPGIKVGPEPVRRREVFEERALLQGAVRRQNGEDIERDPSLALEALTHQRATFTQRQARQFLATRTADAEQLERCMRQVFAHPALVQLGQDGRGAVRFTTREMLEVERQLLAHARALAGVASDPSKRSVKEQRAHRAKLQSIERQIGLELSGEQRAAVDHLLTPGRRLSVVEGVAGSGKSTLLNAAAAAWRDEGLQVFGGALAGAAAAQLQASTGLPSRTLAALERHWLNGGHDGLGPKAVLVIDEAGLIGTRQLERVLRAVHAHGGKAALVGDSQQLQAIEAGAPMRAIASEIGSATLSVVRRQRASWQRTASEQLSVGNVGAAVRAYEQHGSVVRHETQQEAVQAAVRAWSEARKAEPNATQVMLAYRKVEVRALNEAARRVRKAAGELGYERVVQTERGLRTMAEGDRVQFLRNERSLGVTNGTLGTLETFNGHLLLVRLDGKQERRVVVDTGFYRDFDLGYASTIHKAQGLTVDHAHVVASRAFDRHASYVAMTRHKQEATLHWSGEEFESRGQLDWCLSRQGQKDLAHDYIGPRQLRAQSLGTADALTPKTSMPEGRLAQLDEIDLRIARQTAQDEVQKLQAKSATYEEMLQRIELVADSREALVRAKAQLAVAKDARKNYEQAHPYKSKLGLGQPSIMLLGESRPLRLGKAEQVSHKEVAEREHHARIVESSLWVRLEAAELVREAAAERIAAKNALRDLNQELQTREQALNQKSPEARYARLQEMKIAGHLASFAPRMNQAEAIEAVPAVQVARRKYEEAQQLEHTCIAKRLAYKKAHPVKSKLGLQEPQLDDPIGGRKNCRLSKVEAGVQQILKERQAELTAARWSEQTKATAQTLLLNSQDERSHLAKRGRVLGDLIRSLAPSRGLGLDRIEEQYGRKELDLEM